MKFVPGLRIGAYTFKLYRLLSGATTCICTAPSTSRMAVSEKSLEPSTSRMAVGEKSLGVITEKSSTACVHIRATGQRAFLLSLLTAAILGGTILYHLQTSWRLPTSFINDPTRYMPQVNRSHRGNNAERTSGCLVTGETWGAILRNTERVPTPSYIITEPSIQAFQAVSIIYPEYVVDAC